MTDLQYLIHVARRMTLLEWAGGIASMAIIVGWTLFAVSL